MKAHEIALYKNTFEMVARRQLYLVFILTIAFLAYYALLLVGAAYFTNIFSIQIVGRINIGIIFTISQYFFGGIIAWVYVQKMHAIDVALDSDLKL